MKIKIVSIVSFCALVFCSTAFSGQTLIDTVAEGCKSELSTYCDGVTPGEGRVLACLYSRNDKLSGKCEFALYDAASQLERALSALSYVANECADDLKNNCAGVEAGEGRLLECLEQNGDKVSDRCMDAVKAVGLK
jgi:hypothetical protein